MNLYMHTCVDSDMQISFNVPCRHSSEMIEKLETAGLGFYVRVTETQQKLGDNSHAHVVTATYRFGK